MEGIDNLIKLRTVSILYDFQRDYEGIYAMVNMTYMMQDIRKWHLGIIYRDGPGATLSIYMSVAYPELHCPQY